MKKTKKVFALVELDDSAITHLCECSYERLNKTVMECLAYADFSKVADEATREHLEELLSIAGDDLPRAMDLFDRIRLAFTNASHTGNITPSPENKP